MEASFAAVLEEQGLEDLATEVGLFSKDGLPQVQPDDVAISSTGSTLTPSSSAFTSSSISPNPSSQSKSSISSIAAINSSMNAANPNIKIDTPTLQEGAHQSSSKPKGKTKLNMVKQKTESFQSMAIEAAAKKLNASLPLTPFSKQSNTKTKTKTNSKPKPSTSKKRQLTSSSSNSQSKKTKNTTYTSTSKIRNNREVKSKGLRHFSMRVCQKVEEKMNTTYNEVADELVKEYTQVKKEPGQKTYDEKNIRRRVYDALNVLMAMDIISKEKKNIFWKGLPGCSTLLLCFACLFTYLLTYLLVCLLACLLVCLLTCLFTYLLTYLLTYLFAYLLLCLLTSLLTY